tara:strand:- start:13159 stop:14895 length:1737 start_codon:yes stop_codon:yes gene_type:complete
MGLSLRGTTSGAIDINPPAVAGDNAITLPASNGSANQFFKNSGTAGIVTYSSMVETSGGLVGIGTENPLNGLDVNQSEGRLRVNRFSHLLMQNKNDSTTDYWGISARNGGELDIGYGTPDGNSLIGGDKVTITSAGKIGIGVASPDEMLEITSSGTGSQMQFRDTSTGSAAGDGFRVGYNGSGGQLWNFENTFIRFATNNAERLRITSAGLVGIGLTNPDRVLHLAQANSTAYSGTDAFDKDYHVLKLNNTTDDGTVGMQFLIGSDGEAAITASEVAGSATDLIFSTRSGGNKTEKLRIKSAGNIGIGTNNPSELLHMFSSSNLTLKIQTTGVSSPSTIEFKGPSNGRIDFTPDDSGSASGRIVYVHSDDSMQFSTKASGGNITERLRISSAGAFGLAGANYGNAGQVIKSNGSSAAPTWQNLYSYFFYGQQDTQTNIATATYINLKNLGTRSVALGDASIASWDESNGELTIGSSGAGYWFLSCAAGIDDIQSADFIQVVISKNGTVNSLGTNVSTYGRSWNGVTANQVVVDNTSCITELAANDVVRFYVYHNEGTTEPTEPNRCFAMGYRIGGTSG